MKMRALTSVAGTFMLLTFTLADCAAADRQVREPGEKASAAARLRAPGQPAHGPGSSDYPHGRVDKRLHGEGPDGYWLFTPADPVPAEAPLVLFLHGTRALNPYDYGGWIEHLVRRGNVVIYPIFEATNVWQAKKEGNVVQMERAIKATKKAIADLEKQGKPRLRLDRFSITGHSFGGGLTGQLAARAGESGLPKPLAVMPVQPGWKGKEKMPLGELAKIPADALLLVIEGDSDQFAESRQGLDMVKAATSVPWERKAFVRMLSDERDGVKLISDHAAPLAPKEGYGPPFSRKQERRREMAAALTGMREGEEDALDFLGYWKLFDELREAAFSGKNMDAVLGTGTELSLGEWSDGKAIKPMKIVRKP